MKRKISKQVLTLVLSLIAMAGHGFAQSAPASGTPQTEAVSESDHLPFMQSEESPSSQEPSSGGLLLKTLGSMLIIVGLIFFGAWGAKKLGFGGIKVNPSGDIDLAVLSSVSLGNGRTISMVRFGERVLIVGSTPQSFTLLAEETPAEKISIENPRSVAEMLAEEESLFESEFERASFELQEGGLA